LGLNNLVDAAVVPRLVAWPSDWHTHGPYLLLLEQRLELERARRQLEPEVEAPLQLLALNERGGALH